MPKYFFHTRDGSKFMQDHEGTVVPDLAAARREAILAAREMMAEMILQGRVVNGQQFEITDETGTVVDIVPYRSAMRLE